MALTDNEKTKVIEMVTLATAVSHDKLIDAIKEQTEINTKLHIEMTAQTADIRSMSAKITNGMSGMIMATRKDVEVIKNEVNSKEGSIHKIWIKMNYQWIPLSAAIFGIIFLFVKGPEAVSASAYTTQTKVMTEQVETLSDIKTLLEDQNKHDKSENVFMEDVQQGMKEMREQTNKQTNK